MIAVILVKVPWRKRSRREKHAEKNRKEEGKQGAGRAKGESERKRGIERDRLGQAADISAEG